MPSSETISLIAVLLSIVFFIWNRVYTKKQITLIGIQIEQNERQYTAQHIPNPEIIIHEPKAQNISNDPLRITIRNSHSNKELRHLSVSVSMRLSYGPDPRKHTNNCGTIGFNQKHEIEIPSFFDPLAHAEIERSKDDEPFTIVGNIEVTIEFTPDTPDAKKQSSCHYIRYEYIGLGTERRLKWSH